MLDLTSSDQMCKNVSSKTAGSLSRTLNHPINSTFSTSALFPAPISAQNLPEPVPVVERPEWGRSAPWISIVALLVSFAVAGYTIWKDLRARRHSIEDDYWFRKIVGPVAIEPLLKGILDLIVATPADTSSVLYSSAAVQNFHDTQVKTLSDLAVNATSLQLIDDRLAINVAYAIDEIQELVISYCSGQIDANPSSTPKAKDFQIEVRTKLMAMLMKIKIAQGSLS